MITGKMEKYKKPVTQNYNYSYNPSIINPVSQKEVEAEVSLALNKKFHIGAKVKRSKAFAYNPNEVGTIAYFVKDPEKIHRSGLNRNRLEILAVTWGTNKEVSRLYYTTDDLELA